MREYTCDVGEMICECVHTYRPLCLEYLDLGPDFPGFLVFPWSSMSISGGGCDHALCSISNYQNNNPLTRS